MSISYSFIVVVWKLINEEWWFSRMIGANWQHLPQFFQSQLMQKWHASLWKKSGKSCQLSPLVWDTGAGSETQSQYLHHFNT